MIRMRQKLRRSGLESGFLSVALCLVAVCASAQDDTLSTAIPLPLTFSQKFALTNKLLFASPENQLQNMKIVYAYNPDEFSDVLNKIKIHHKSQQSSQPNKFQIKSQIKLFGIGKIKPADRKGIWDLWKKQADEVRNLYEARELPINLSLDNNEIKKAFDVNVDINFIAISRDDHEKFVDNIDPTDKIASNSAKNAKQFFIFKSGR